MDILQERCVVGDNGGVNALGRVLAQTFTPTISHRITKIRLKLFRTGVVDPGLITVKVVATNEGYPDGSVIIVSLNNSETPFNVADLTTNPSGHWYSIPLSEIEPGFADLVAGVQYCIWIGDVPTGLCWRVNTNSPYIGGKAYKSILPSPYWEVLSPNSDFMFEEWSVISGEEGENEVVWGAPEIQTTGSDYVSSSIAYGRGYISGRGLSALTEFGICWNTIGNPTIADSKIGYTDGSSLALMEDNLAGIRLIQPYFQVYMHGLLPNTKYYFRAYATNSYGIGYGNIQSFVTLGIPETVQDIPVGESPSDEAIGINLTPTLIGTGFCSADVTHNASQYQITITPGDYSNPIFDSEEDNLNLVNITVPECLEPNTTYYWHVRYQDSTENWSDYSSEVSFTTTAEKKLAGLMFRLGIVSHHKLGNRLWKRKIPLRRLK